MNPDAPPLARHIFLQALEPGPLGQSAAVAATLAKLESQGDGSHLDVDELEVALDTEFPWRNQLVFQSHQLHPEELETWIQAIRGLMQALLAMDMSADGHARRFQVLLTALGVLDVRYEGLSAVSARLANSHFSLSLIAMLEKVGLAPEGLDKRTKEWLRELSGDVNAGNFKMLTQAQRVLQPRFHADIWTAIFLLWRLEPKQLASLIEKRDNILWDIVVCMVLGGKAPQFALQVRSITFKFISLSWFEWKEQTHTEPDTIGVYEQLLLQVAKTQHWKPWLQATHEYPVAHTQESSRTLAEVLTKLSEPQWKDYIYALALYRSGDSAQAVADILSHVARKVGFGKAQSIWLDAFERWNAWDYGRYEEHFFLSSPQACTFDFPVAMYYSLMLAEERDALARELEYAILYVEQSWFSSETELCTERNRLASRLRLIRHGSILASGGTDALPPSAQPDSEYAEVRYRYHDVNAPRTRSSHR